MALMVISAYVANSRPVVDLVGSCGVGVTWAGPPDLPAGPHNYPTGPWDKDAVRPPGPWCRCGCQPLLMWRRCHVDPFEFLPADLVA